MKKVIISTLLTLMFLMVPVAALENDIVPLADVTRKSSYRESINGVRLTFYSSGNYTSSGVIIGNMSTTETGGNAFNFFDNIVKSRKNGTSSPYAKCTFNFVYAGSATPSSASVNEPLIHYY